MLEPFDESAKSQILSMSPAESLKIVRIWSRELDRYNEVIKSMFPNSAAILPIRFSEHDYPCLYSKMIGIWSLLGHKSCLHIDILERMEPDLMRSYMYSLGRTLRSALQAKLSPFEIYSSFLATAVRKGNLSSVFSSEFIEQNYARLTPGDAFKGLSGMPNYVNVMHMVRIDFLQKTGKEVVAKFALLDDLYKEIVIAKVWRGGLFGI